MPKYGLKNFLRIAKTNLEPDTRTFDGLEQYLCNWFCEKFKTTPNDYRLQEMTLEELVVLWQQERLREDPTLYAVEIEGKEDVGDYEKWLQEEMGDTYVTEKENIQQMLEYEDEQKLKRKQRDEELQKVAEKLPDRITTDFSRFRSQDE